MKRIGLKDPLEYLHPALSAPAFASAGKFHTILVENINKGRPLFGMD
jgi:hypothetical protein